LLADPARDDRQSAGACRTWSAAGDRALTDHDRIGRCGISSCRRHRERWSGCRPAPLCTYDDRVSDCRAARVRWGGGAGDPSREPSVAAATGRGSMPTSGCIEWGDGAALGGVGDAHGFGCPSASTCTDDHHLASAARASARRRQGSDVHDTPSDPGRMVSASGAGTRGSPWWSQARLERDDGGETCGVLGFHP
jgi:hypothetical protein